MNFFAVLFISMSAYLAFYAARSDTGHEMLQGQPFGGAELDV